MKVEIELDDAAETAVIVESIKWHYEHGEPSLKLKKAFRKVIKYYMTHQEWKDYKNGK